MFDKEKPKESYTDALQPIAEPGNTEDSPVKAGREDQLSKRGTAKGDRKEDALADDKRRLAGARIM